MTETNDNTSSLTVATEMSELTEADWDKLHARLLGDLDELCSEKSCILEESHPTKSLFGKWLAWWRKR